MKVITTNKELEALHNIALSQTYVTLDTEFISEKTYFPKLCLIQIALPEDENSGCTEYIIDTLSPDIRLDHLKELIVNPDITKVFHSAYQDLEIFLHLFGEVPEPLFDTQVAAMVCGYGSNISYSNLVKDICRAKLDKSQQFSNWSTRPLSKQQLNYAISDVTHLRDVYTNLYKKLLENRRLGWVEELFSEMVNTCKNSNKPQTAWKKIKTKNLSGVGWSILFALAEFREVQAQKRDIPRRRILSDQAIKELAYLKPKTFDELKKGRFFHVGSKIHNRFNTELLEVISNAISNPKHPSPIEHSKGANNASREVTDLLKVYLRYSSEQSGVAEELIATVDELREIAQGNLNVRPLKGWRKKLFGDNALKLCQGKIALTIENSKLAIVE